MNTHNLKIILLYFICISHFTMPEPLLLQVLTFIYFNRRQFQYV